MKFYLMCISFLVFTSCSGRENNDSIQTETIEVKKEYVEIVSSAELKHAFSEVRDASVAVHEATTLSLIFQDRDVVGKLQSTLEPIFLKYKRLKNSDPKSLYSLENVKIEIRGYIKRRDHDKSHYQVVYTISFPSSYVTSEFNQLLQEQVNMTMDKLK